MVPYGVRGGNDLVRRWITSMHRSEKGEEAAAVSGLEEFSSCVAAYFGTELVRNAVEIQLLFCAQQRKGRQCYLRSKCNDSISRPRSVEWMKFANFTSGGNRRKRRCN